MDRPRARQRRVDVSNSNATTAIVKHYRRANARARDKELITELVRDGSETDQFLKRMERLRLSRACTRTVDMRGKTPYKCASYKYKNQTFWMDDVSYNIFQDGLKDHNGVFTVGTYEQIVNGAHTFKSMQQAQQPPQTQPTQSASGPRTAATTTSAAGAERGEPDPLDKYRSKANAPEVLPLGYYYRRREPRVEWVSEVSLSSAGQLFLGTTRDVSAHGLRVHCKAAPALQPGDTVEVTFSEPNTEELPALASVPYDVVDVEQHDTAIVVRLHQNPQAPATAAETTASLVEEALNSSRARDRRDSTDDVITATSLLVEKFYTRGTPLAPFVVGREGDAPPRVVAVFSNENNEALLESFRNRDDHFALEFLATDVLSQEFERCMANDYREEIMVASWPNGTAKPAALPRSACDSDAHWYSLLSAHAHRDGFRIFKLTLHQVSPPQLAKLQRQVENLSKKAPEDAEQLLKNLDTLCAVGAIVDVTAEIGLDDTELPQSDSLPSAGDGERNPRVLAFGTVEHRREERYRVTMEVSVKVEGQHYDGKTEDFSVHGASIRIGGDPHGVQRGETIRVTFPNLQKRALLRANLKDIPYEIVEISVDEDSVVVHLKRLPDKRQDSHTAFFKELIDTNREKLPLDVTEAALVAQSRLYESVIAESTGTIPLLLSRDSSSGERAIRVALPAQPGPLAEFFEVAPGCFDFSALAVPTRLADMMKEPARGAQCSTVLYLFKRPLPNGHEFEILAASAEQLRDPQERARFVTAAEECDFRIVKVMVAPARELAEHEINAVLDPLSASAPRDTRELRRKLAGIVAIGDIVDVTTHVPLR